MLYFMIFQISGSIIDEADVRCSYCDDGSETVAVQSPANDRSSCPGRYGRIRTVGWLVAVGQGRSPLAAFDSDVIG